MLWNWYVKLYNFTVIVTYWIYRTGSDLSTGLTGVVCNRWMQCESRSGFATRKEGDPPSLKLRRTRCIEINTTLLAITSKAKPTAWWRAWPPENRLKPPRAKARAARMPSIRRKIFWRKGARPEIGRNAPQPVNIFTRIRTILKNKLFKQCRQDGLEAWDNELLIGEPI